MTKKARVLILTIAALITFLSAGVIVFFRHYYYGWLEKNTKTDIFFGQSEGGVCTHDESYTEPIIPNGRYYPDGNISAPYYLEITENRFCRLTAADGTTETLLKIAYENNQISNHFADKKEFRVITSHYKDNVFFCLDWDEIRRFNLNDYRGEILPSEIRSRNRSDDFLWEVNEYRCEKLDMSGAPGLVITDENNNITGFNCPNYDISPDYSFKFLYCDEY